MQFMFRGVRVKFCSGEILKPKKLMETVEACPTKIPT